MLLAAPAEASSALLCSEREQPTTCRDLSVALVKLIDAVSPGAGGALAAALLDGYAVDASTVVRCQLHVSCDAWPVAILAASAVTEGVCPLDPEVCSALQVALAEDGAGEAVSLVDRLVAELAGSHDQERITVLGREIGNIMIEMPDRRRIVDTVVALAYLALTLPPAASPGGLVPATAHTGGAEVLESDTAEEIGLVTALDEASGVPLSAVTKQTQRCRASYKLYASLETSEGSSFRTFVISAWAGIYDLRWTDLNESHSRCQEPSVAFNGSMFVEATSNGGSFIASSTKRSGLEQVSEVLYLGGPPAAVDVDWETDKVEVEYDFPYGFVIHNYAPPAGNYRSEASAHVALRGGYFTTPTRTTEKSYSYECRKQGNSATGCRYP